LQVDGVIGLTVKQGNPPRPPVVYRKGEHRCRRCCQGSRASEIDARDTPWSFPSPADSASTWCQEPGIRKLLRTRATRAYTRCRTQFGIWTSYVGWCIP
jgi:hypothetical protein